MSTNLGRVKGTFWFIGTVSTSAEINTLLKGQGSNPLNADLYLNMLNGDIWQYALAQNTWNKQGNIKGATGDGFSVAKIYSSVASMNSGYLTDGLAIGSFVMINTDNVADADNSKLYMKGNTAYTFLTDLSGSQGIKGDTGVQGNKGDKGDSVYIRYADNASGTNMIPIWNEACTYMGVRISSIDSDSPSAYSWVRIKGATGNTGATGATGNTGATGAKGDAGTPAGFSSPTALAQTLPAGSAATIQVTTSGTDTAKVFAFAFGIPKGDTGATGTAGSNGNTWFTGSIDNAAGIHNSFPNAQVGDSYFCTVSPNNVYTKTGSTTWALSASLKGLQGTAGTNGTDGKTPSFSINALGELVATFI